MALLVAYMVTGKGVSLADWLDANVFADMEKTVSYPDKNGREGFEKYMENFQKGLYIFK